MADSSLMTREQYASHRGVTPQAISKLMGAGKIPFAKKGRRVMIDPAEADFALGEARERINSDDDEEIDDRPDPRGGTFAAAPTGGLTKARTATEVYRAKLAELEYRQRVGQVLPIEAIVAAVERAATAATRELDLLPALAEDIFVAGEKDGVVGVRQALKKAGRAIREQLTEAMRNLALEGEEGGREAA